MSKILNYALTALFWLALTPLVSAAPDAGQRTEQRPLDARVVRVKIEGVLDLKVRQGSPASLTLTGEPRWLERMTVKQSGDTLVLDSDMHEMRLRSRSGVRAEMVLPNLRELSAESFGTTEISGFQGEQLELALDGAGAMNVRVDYRLINATLGGVGSMKLSTGDAVGISLNLQGAGYVTLSGSSKWLKAELGGLGGLDAHHFTTEQLTLDLSGLGSASVAASQSVDLNLSGMGSVTVYGKPLNRRVSVDGLGKVSWR